MRRCERPAPMRRCRRPATLLLTVDRERAVSHADKCRSSLVVWVGADREPSVSSCASIQLSVGDSRLQHRLERAIVRALRDEIRASQGAPSRPVVRVPSRRCLDRCAAAVRGAVAVVPVSLRNLGRIEELVERLREAGAAGVQLVWDGETPDRATVEPRVFAVLEKARATPAQAPVVLAGSEAVVASLRILIDARQRRAKS